MRLVRLLTSAMAVSACWVAAVPAQETLGRPFPSMVGESNAERPGPDVNFRAAKFPEDNAAARDFIAAKLQEAIELLKALDRQRTLQAAAGAPIPRGADDPERLKLADAKEAWQQKSRNFTNESACAPGGLTQDVEWYDGSLGPTRASVDAWQPATGLIRWIRNLEAAGPRLGGDTSNIDWGNVQGANWCTGTLLANNLLLTAGHCFNPNENGYSTPSRRINGKYVSMSYDDLAKLMEVVFNYQLDRANCDDQVDPRTCHPHRTDVYPIVRVLEFGSKRPNVANVQLDYAIVELGPNAAGQLPTDQYSSLPFDVEETTLENAQILTIIQHPQGQPKRIAAGRHLRADATAIYYSDVSTMGVSSGAGVLDQAGRLIGVHTSGGCDTKAANFENRGVTLNAVSQVSDLIH